MSEQSETPSNDEAQEPGTARRPPAKEEQMKKVIVGTEEKGLKPEGVQHFTKKEERHGSDT